jgi:hypothetical protein
VGGKERGNNKEEGEYEESKLLSFYVFCEGNLTMIWSPTQRVSIII